MASLPASCSITTASLLPSRPKLTFSKPPHFSTLHDIAPPAHRIEVRCENSPPNPPETNSQLRNNKLLIDRRNVLLGIGTGLYGSSSNYLNAPPASASPIQSPDISKCTGATNLNIDQPITENCCPKLAEPVDYKLPHVFTKRFRPAAHLASKEYVDKYERAIALMKALPEDDPRNFMQQANVHCAYCNLAYQQTGDPNVKLQVHHSWLFFPFHRWYLYFYERILGKLIDDPTFGLPFWNWDNPSGMYMPDMFVKGGPGSSLYDPLRNIKHFPPTIVDLNYDGTDPAKNRNMVLSNLSEMYTEMVRTLNTSNLTDFYGAKYVTGMDPDPGQGTVERGSHTAVHNWGGSTCTPSGEDLGNFYSAGRDPMFYSHHANVDRLWSIWRTLRGQKPKDFDTCEWLDANFVFYDENARLVKVRVGECLENDLMGYNFQEVPIPWLRNRVQARVKKSRVAMTSRAPSPMTIFPVRLDKTIKVVVDRRKKSRRNQGKEEGEEEEDAEYLVIEGIEVDTSRFVKFDVFINDEDDDPNDFDKAEYAGCYAQVPHKNAGKVKSKIRLALTELLQDLDVEDDDQILVSSVPKAGGDHITVGGIKIVSDA